jgi:hypothetical protein
MHSHYFYMDTSNEIYNFASFNSIATHTATLELLRSVSIYTQSIFFLGVMQLN